MISQMSLMPIQTFKVRINWSKKYAQYLVSYLTVGLALFSCEAVSHAELISNLKKICLHDNLSRLSRCGEDQILA